MFVGLSPLVTELIEKLTCLPGVGRKSAQRMAFYLLERSRDNGLRLADCLERALTRIQHCRVCRTFTENDTCTLCLDPKRDHTSLCIVENPIDVVALEQIHAHRGLYFVLMGHLSPIDGIGPDALGIPLLAKRLQENTIVELILATNATIEGEATAHYIAMLAKKQHIKTSRIAYGVPVGGELDLIDGSTLSHSFSSRRLYETETLLEDK